MKWYEDPKYIKMAEKATEIQEQFKEIDSGDIIRLNRDLDYQFKSGDILHRGDWINGEKDEGYYRIYDGYDGSQSFSRDDFTWLPSQNRLQDMMIDRFQEHKYPLWQMMYVFNNFIACPPLRHRKKYVDWLRKYVTQFTTLEQLWMAFIMERKFKKIWNGEDWVVA